jgi:isoamylase
MQRIDVHPTHTFGEYKLRPGRPYPYGATFVPDGVNFAVFSRHATACTLVLFEKGNGEPLVEIPFPEEFRVGNVYTMIVFGLDAENIEYGFRMDGPCSPRQGHWFDVNNILLDPYAKAIGGRDVWGAVHQAEHEIFPHRGFLPFEDFDWENDRPLNTPIEDLIIYELHVRSFTRHASAGVKYPGTYAAIHEKIPYLKELGVNCIELMPIFEFDEFENPNTNPFTGERLMNCWGYSSFGFFAPKAGYAATGKFGMQVDEFKNLVKELHRNGIEVMLDVVFNHTAEGDENGPTISFRGIDNKTYYMLAPDGSYFNFSGCGNTMNCNNPIVRMMVLDCLRYWVSEYHIDGFRFDLAAILGRDQQGVPLANPPLLEVLAYDPVLANAKLIAEAWDAGGLYQVGSFPAYGRWAEWNGKYRDTLRRFLKGDAGQVGELAQRLQGSPDLYEGRGPAASINFITSHDGFCLADLFGYNEKHNWANGEENRDGQNDNYSWNCGWEGPSDDPQVNALRLRQMKNAVAILLTSQGVPMIHMGDEMGHTKQGNNNTFCQDNELSWLDWSLPEKNANLFRFVQNCIAFRHAHPVLRSRQHFEEGNGHHDPGPNITWHGVQAWNADWAPHSRTLAFMVCGESVPGSDVFDDVVYVAMNMHWENHVFELPRLLMGLKWHLFANTRAPEPGDSFAPGTEPLLSNQRHILIGARSVVVLVARQTTNKQWR